MKFRIGFGKKIGKFYVGASHTIGGKNNNSNIWLIIIAILFFPITLAIIFGKWLYKKTQQQKAVDPESVWYKQTYGIILTLVFFFPVGLYLMWKYGKGWNQNLKIGVSVACGLMLIVSMLASNSNGNGNDDSMVDSGIAAVASVTTTTTTRHSTEVTTVSTTTTTVPEETTETETTMETTEMPAETTESTSTEKMERKYMINYKSGVFHSPSCHTIKDSSNVKEYTGTAEELEAKGYKRCGVCKPW